MATGQSTDTTQHLEGQHSESTPEARELVLAREAIERGWTARKAARALRARMRRDEHYLAYRRLRGFDTEIDRAIAADLYPLALAAMYLEEGIRDQE